VAGDRPWTVHSSACLGPTQSLTHTYTDSDETIKTRDPGGPANRRCMAVESRPEPDRIRLPYAGPRPYNRIELMFRPGKHRSQKTMRRKLAVGCALVPIYETGRK